MTDVEFVVQNMTYPMFVCERSFSTYPHLTKLQKNNRDYDEFESIEIRNPLWHSVRSILSLIDSGILCDHMIRLKIQEIFILCRHYYTTQELGCIFYPMLDKRMNFYMKVHTARPKASTVKELAELSGYSLSNFKLLFKQYFNETPYSWISKWKADALQLSLADESKPLKLLVEELGFADQSHMNNFCKRYLGGTALQVRNNILGI